MHNKRNLYLFLIIFNLFYFTFLFIEDRINVKTEIEEIESRGSEWEVFINFFKSLWRTILAVLSRIFIFWFWIFFKIGFILFIFEFIGIYKKGQVVLKGVIYSQTFVFMFILFSFFSILIFKKEPITSLNFISSNENKLNNFILSSIEFFKICEFFYLFWFIKKHIKISETTLTLLLIPLFFIETFIKWVYYI